MPARMAFVTVVTVRIVILRKPEGLPFLVKIKSANRIVSRMLVNSWLRRISVTWHAAGKRH